VHRKGVVEGNIFVDQKKNKVFALSCHPYGLIFDHFCEQLVSDYEQNHPGKGVTPVVRRRWIDAAVWLISALQDAYNLGIRSVILPRSKTTFRGKRFGYQITTKVVEILSTSGWVTLSVARSGVNVDRASEIISSAKLRRLFKRTGFVWAPRQYDDSKEVIVLRQRDDFLMEKFTLPTPNTSAVAQMRAEVHEINQWMLGYVVFPYLPNRAIKDLLRGNDDKFCDFSNLTYRRIFALGRFDKGGRFYGGWWQQIPARYRPYIRINDEPTVELDFGATIVTLLYGQRGLTLPTEPYDLGINPEGDLDKRSAIKKYIAALLNASGGYQLPKEERALLGVTSRQLRTLVEGKHPGITDAFGTGIGLDLMYLDSKIALLTKQALRGQGVPVLGIHDGFVVPERHEQLLHDIMMSSFKQVAGIYPTIKRTAPSVIRFAPRALTMYERFLSGFRRSAKHPDGCLAPLHM
jgi:hypothetical protein